MVVIVGRHTGHYMLTRLLRRVGLSREQFHFCSLDENPFTIPGAKVFVPIGTEGLRKLTGESDIFRFANRTIPLRSGQWILPNFCPTQVLPFKRKIGDDQDDYEEEGTRTPTRFQGVASLIFRNAVRIDSGEFTPIFPEKTYLCDPTPLEFARWAHQWISRHDIPCSFDIETPYVKPDEQDEKDLTIVQDDQTILRISFSFSDHVAASIPYRPEYFETIQDILKAPSSKIVWNGRTFDIPRLQKNGFEVCGEIWDGMDLFHWVHSDLDKGLEFASSFYTSQLPWKHINNSEPAKYSCIDADVARLCVMGMKDSMTADAWASYHIGAIECMEVLTEAGRRGNYIDIPAQEQLKAELEVETERISTIIQTVVPDDRKPAKAYKRQPEHFDFTGTDEGKVKICSRCGEQVTSKILHLKGGKKNPCHGADILTIKGSVPIWYQRLPFNANSSDQLIAYAAFYGHPIGKNHKTGNDSIDSKHLVKLANKFGREHPLYDLTVELHKVAKALSTYVIGMRPDALGKVYTTFVNVPSTWRLSSQAVNMQNQGKRESNKWAKRARKTIIAPPGWKIVQADSSSIEAVITGYLMDDPHYVEIAKRSVHAYLCCKWNGWEPTDENIARIKNEPQYSELYEQLKRVVHGTAYGMGVRMMYYNDPKTFPSVKAAKQCQDFLFAEFPKLKTWQNLIRQQAQKDCYLTSPWGHKHYFYDVFTYQVNNSGKLIYGNDGQPRVRLGKDSKRAIAYLPQHCAGMFARENLALLGRTKARGWMGANCSVHDSYALVVPDACVEEAADILVNILTRPIPQLGNLRIGCEVEVGQNWGEMKKIRTVKTL